MERTATRVIEIALAEEGYLEKATNAQLDSKTANAGRGNWTKYARDLHAAGYYNGNKNGYAWCDVFFDWLIWKLCGEDAEKAQSIICQTGPYGAGCTNSAQYYKQGGRFHTANPVPGDQIFFWNAGKTAAAHTGLVYKVDDTYVYTIEGNTSGDAGVVENGGGVFRKKYTLNYHRIYGYGRPRYDAETKKAEANKAETQKEGFEVILKTLKKGDKGAQVKALQAMLIGFDYDLGRSGADGDFGAKTDEALRKFQSRNGLTVDGVAGPKTWDKMHNG